MSWWVLDLYQDDRIVELLSWIVWVIFSITMHELAHGWAALWQGDDTPRRLKHLTLNPMVHMGPWSLLVFAVVGIAWGAMPTDPGRYRWRRRGRIVVAGAGPAMNVALTVITLGGLVVWLALGPKGTPLYENLAIFLWTGGWLNIVLAGFNLLPVPPLDGAQILAGLSFRAWRLLQHPQAPMIGMLVLLVLFVTDLGWPLLVAAMLAAALLVDLAGGWLGNPPLYDIVM